jgi:hypothetical protein
MPRHVPSLAVLGAAAMLAAGALSAHAPVVARSAVQPVLTGRAPLPELEPGRHNVTAAGATKADDEDSDDAGDGPPEEPELEQIPVVPVSDTQSLAV